MIFSWTNTYNSKPKIYKPRNELDLKKIIIKKKNFINFGNGRSYGDNCINKKNIILMKNFNKILFFDKMNGIVDAQSGVFLKDLLDKVMKYDWFFPTSPGTKYVTLGGLIANNVHGKSIKKNFFYDYINSLTIINPSGKKIECSRLKNRELFDLTIGGMGLTGVIVSVNFLLKRIPGTEVEVKKIFNSNLKFLSNFHKSIKKSKWEYAVIWLDSFKYNESIKSITILARHNNKISDLKVYKNREISQFHITIFSIVNNFFLFRFVNLAYLFINKIFNSGKDHILNFFYLFDSYKDWYKLYGSRGFKEYQFAISKKNVLKFLNEYYFFCKKNNIFSNLIVLKPINQKKHFLSLHGNGFSISMDFKFYKNINIIDNFFIDMGKKYRLNFNLSKDLSLTSSYFENNKNYKIFKKKIKAINNQFKFRSEQSDRLGITSEK